MSTLTAVSLFSGCGGFDYGASTAGLSIIWANDVDKHAAAAYRKLMPGVNFVTQDVRKINSFPKADVLIGCYPCTGFSLAARRKWHDRTDRDLKNIEGNFLYKEFIRAIPFVKPKYLFIENVGGMTSADGGWFFKEQLRGLREAGYIMKHSTLRAESYGLAQTRKRVFLVGIREDIATDFEYYFPEPTHGTGVLPIKTLYDVIGNFNTVEEDVLQTKFHGHYLTRNRKRSWNEPSFTIVADANHVPLHPVGEPMVQAGKDHWLLQGRINRRLSWRECAAIQGFPHDQLDTDSNLRAKYKVIGNAVPPCFGYSIVRPVVEYELGHRLSPIFENAFCEI
ncbi:MAG: DNA (cytosine-5-)-methyltransferase [Cytophagales bacterium CG18_big_fil_WC_8_21_14_2_50_42_9]|nr:MAG: DNA (cytosine-5-)-methyltransferase [Cytophagales bacterium CG18_big_fil_WC_8_21_14_2_50_42_9]